MSIRENSLNFLQKYWKTFLFGLLSGLSFAPLYVFIFAPFGFYYLINKLNNLTISNNKKIFLQSFAYGIIFGFGYFLTQLYWISFSLLVDIKSYFWLLPFAVIVIPFLCAIYLGFGTLLTTFILNKIETQNRFLITVVFSFCFVISEYVRGFIFPWSIFSYILGFSDILIQISYLLNIYIIDFILVLLFSSSFVLFDYRDNRIIFLKKNKYYFILYLSIVLFIVIFGIIRLKNANIKNFNTKIRIVQANIPQTLKWDRNEAENIIDKYLELSTKEDLNNIDIIIWSESSIPYILTKESGLPYNFQSLKDKILITGAVRGELKHGKIEELWNSLFIFKDGNIIDYYDKSILVPFGEYIPFSKYLPFIKKITAGDIEFSQGTGNKTIKLNNLNISPIICYEIAFANNVIDNTNKPDIIINLTNDGWFGKSSGPYQHLVLAKFRAVENKLPIIRVSNSGISAYIDEYGRVLKKISLDIIGVLDIEI